MVGGGGGVGGCVIRVPKLGRFVFTVAVSWASVRFISAFRVVKHVHLVSSKREPPRSFLTLHASFLFASSHHSLMLTPQDNHSHRHPRQPPREERVTTASTTHTAPNQLPSTTTWDSSRAHTPNINNTPSCSTCLKTWEPATNPMRIPFYSE